ncbi:hypothetical protein MOBT1_000884 [Malassezia obtusa]|uniref:3'-5' exonuclease n=1 Tax=Malassezia obtusa TaxID=76774 RepID=A0AAF0E2X7_9BASI|nr:hypothetical protein MOBT1_000884 [Malassezia obtusa]
MPAWLPGGGARVCTRPWLISYGIRRCWSSRAKPWEPAVATRELDRLAGSIADAAHRHLQEQEHESPYTYRQPLGTVRRACAQLVVYLSCEEQVNERLPSALEHSGTVSRAVGFDLEWNMTPYTGKTAVIQIGVADSIYIVQLSMMQRVPPSIATMMADPTVLKVGVAVRNDAHKLRRDFGIVSNGLVELSTMAKLVDPDRWKHRRLLISLRDLCEAYLKRALRKDAVRVSQWDKAPLSAEQLEYAASDVYVSLELFHQLLLVAHQRAVERAATHGVADLAHTPLETTLAIVRAATSEVHSAPAKRTKPRPATVKAEEAIPAADLRAHERALQAWRAKQLDFAALAARAGVQITTSASYVMRALGEELAAQRAAGQPGPALGEEERARLRAEFDVAQVRRTVRHHYVFLRSNGVFSAAELRAMQ